MNPTTATQSIPLVRTPAASPNTDPSDSFLVFQKDSDPPDIQVDWFTTPNLAGFAKGTSDTFHSKGLKWKYPSGSTSLTFTFVLGTDVSELESNSKELSFSAVSDGKQTATLNASEATFNFTVVKTTGERHDPQIVVTPL
jgi:hypothetical protein